MHVRMRKEGTLSHVFQRWYSSPTMKLWRLGLVLTTLVAGCSSGSDEPYKPAPDKVFFKNAK
jgi:hypothetical protein